MPNWYKVNLCLSYPVSKIRILDFGNSGFKFVSDFDIRISSLCPATRDQQPATVIMRNKPNLLNTRINVNSIFTKDYDEKRLCEHRENKPNQSQSNPISPRKTGKIPCSTVNCSTVLLSQAKGLPCGGLVRCFFIADEMGTIGSILKKLWRLWPDSCIVLGFEAKLSGNLETGFLEK